MFYAKNMFFAFLNFGKLFVKRYGPFGFVPLFLKTMKIKVNLSVVDDDGTEIKSENMFLPFEPEEADLGARFNQNENREQSQVYEFVLTVFAPKKEDWKKTSVKLDCGSMFGHNILEFQREFRRKYHQISDE